jgi:hypothetical protein
MADSASLLKLLEPAVRPVSGGTGSARSAERASSFESADFDQLLTDARRDGAGGQAREAENASAAEFAAAEAEMPEEASGAGEAKQMLGLLAGVDQMQNPSLRSLAAEHGNAGDSERSPEKPDISAERAESRQG